MLLLVVTNLRLVIENAQKYGLSTWSGSLDISGRDWTLAALCLALMPLHLAISVLVERRAALTPFTEAEESATIRLHIANLVFQISIPTVIVYFFVKHPLPGMVALFLPTILFLKLISYVLVNKELRRERDDKLRRDQGIDVLKSPRPAEDPAKDALDHALLDPDAPPFDPAAVKYPDNLTLGNIGYFWLAPTLCYQPCYPRITRFRKSYFAKRVLEMVIVSIGIVFLAGQYALPTLKNSTTAMKEVSVGRILERLLKLSVTSLYIWILGFYLFFHSFLSAFAEVLQFGDRRFFGEWWNSTSLAEYWRLWNSVSYVRDRGEMRR
jgi:diacylglycerol O-acyltransferase-1